MPRPSAAHLPISWAQGYSRQRAHWVSRDRAPGHSRGWSTHTLSDDESTGRGFFSPQVSGGTIVVVAATFSTAWGHQHVWKVAMAPMQVLAQLSGMWPSGVSVSTL